MKQLRAAKVLQLRNHILPKGKLLSQTGILISPNSVIHPINSKSMMILTRAICLTAEFVLLARATLHFLNIMALELQIFMLSIQMAVIYTE